MGDINSFKEKLRALVSKFERDKAHYLSKGYPEAQARLDFIDPFFKALGWDISNKADKPPHERDVLVEHHPETTGRPDYNFRVNGQTKFFVEAKAPSVALDNVNHILQAKSYAWSTKEVYFVILTDFEEFRLYDASLKPNPAYPNEGLISDFKYADYLENADKLYELSRERVLEGSLEALLPRDVKSKRLRIPPDKSFLEDLTGWRTELAKDIHKRNPDLDVRVLNDVVQRLLDRIIFIRIAEDRRIRPERELWEIAAQWREEGKRKPIMTHLLDLFREINDDLNGDIFKPHACEKADVDSALLAEIIESLYFPKSRYRFDAIGVELLGSIYERYLGSTIRVTPQRVKVEEKPEVRKAGGVYYTPKYIVDYIVKNTVGKLIEGKSPRQIEKIKILDPACGSGSFLLGAYQYLINYHIEWYRSHPKDMLTMELYSKRDVLEEGLSIHEKAKILRNNIFGVDIDPQAVEITMMSLYLKALEGERGRLPRKQHLLPPLGNNIKCGNSLIGYDILDGRLFDDDTKSRINPFDWASKSTGFGGIMEAGGFDAVIGNPPYVRQEMLGEFKEYFSTHYKVYQGTADLYSYFIEKGVSLLREGGLFSYIVANKWMRAAYGEPLRKWLKKQRMEEIVDFGDLPVFESATTYPCILRIKKDATAKNFSAALVKTLAFNDLSEYVKEHSFKISLKDLGDKGWSLTNEKAQALLNRLKNIGLPLGEYVKGKIYYGIKTGLNEAFVIDEKTKDSLIEEDPKSAEIIKPFLLGRDIKRYAPPESERYLILMPKGWTREQISHSRLPLRHSRLPLRHSGESRNPNKDSGFRVKHGMTETGAWQWLAESYPAIAEHLKQYADKGKKRYDKGEYWWELRACDYYAEFEKPKIIWGNLAISPQFAVDMDANHINAPGVFIPSHDLYLLAILNSPICEWLITLQAAARSGGFLEYKPMYVVKLPIRTIDFSNPKDKSAHDRVVSLVERMLDLHKKKNSFPPSSEREKIEREIAVTDETIDEIVYDLYGITEAERKIIEGK